MYRVVLVDDEPRITEGLKRIVPWAKYHCEIAGVANNAQTGRQMIIEHKPHLLFTDICMPGEDGLTMLAGLKSQFPDMQIVVLSGHGDFDYAQKAIYLGVCRYLLKPSKMHEIQESVIEALSRISTAERKEAELSIGHELAGGFIVNKALECMKKHYAEKLSLQSVGNDCYVSQWHLSKLLNKQLGKNFYSLLNGIRIEKAKELLEDSSLTINNIGEMTGYTEAAHFSRVFKNIVGTSASKYRNDLVLPSK